MFFFLFRVAFKHFFTTPVDIENTKLKLLAAIPTGYKWCNGNATLFTDKTIKDLSKILKKRNIFNKFLKPLSLIKSFNYLSLSSPTK